MAIAEIEGAQLRFELGGAGPSAVLTPGGRLGLDDLAALATELRPHLRLLEWDRRNTGSSDLWLEPGSEQLRWADDLAALLRHLDLAPAWLLGGSAGARVAYLTAVRHPEAVRGLVLWSVSGGHYGSQVLGHDYHVPYVNAALRGGMEAVAETPFYAARLAANPRSRQRLLALAPTDFVDALLRWNEDYVTGPAIPAIAVTDDQLRTITAPTLLFEGNDLVHPPGPAQALHRLIADSVLVPSPWTGDELTERFVGRVPEPLLDLYPRMAPTITRFIAEHELPGSPPR